MSTREPSVDNMRKGRVGVGVSVLSAAGILSVAVCWPTIASDKTGAASNVDGKFIVSNASETRDWPSYGLDYAETRFSKLKQIDDANVKQLGLVWSYDLGSTRGVESTPLVVDGTMYVTAPWSVIHAVDARTGSRLWSYDPEVPRETGRKLCCDVVNRGAALYRGKVYFGTLDGRLISLDAATGKKLWERDTLMSRESPASITGAPRVVKGKVLIGNGGAELGVRGYITAYDAESGEQAWRWFTVPGDPSKPFENSAMEMAAKTWDPSGQYWLAGGGGTVWNGMAYDPDLDLLYIGVGNGAPWSHKARSPNGGDNLFLSSIVALKPDSGEYVWHYQETPADNWDYTATQDIILADLVLDGKQRKVLLHAPKNGFFFVIDRVNGKFISAKNFVEVNWAKGYDEGGRPIEVKERRSTEDAFEIVPGPFGGHNWHSMSFNPILNLAFIPAQTVPLVLQHDKKWKYGSNLPGQPMAGVGWNTAMLVNSKSPEGKPFGRLVAWDPIQQKEVWRHDYVSPWNGGTLSTAGNLVFQGTADGRLIAFRAKTGEKLWDTATGTGVVAAPVTYLVDGRQYVSVAVGWGGVYGQSQRATEFRTPGTVYTFAIGGQAKKPAFVDYQRSTLVSGVKYKQEDVQPGAGLYVSNCVFCHGVPGVDKGGAIPNLGYSAQPIIENLETFIFKGPMMHQGMPDFSEKLAPEDVVKIKAFIQGTADSIRPTS